MKTEKEHMFAMENTKNISVNLLLINHTWAGEILFYDCVLQFK